MTPYQQTAIAFPCYFAIETSQPRYVHMVNMGSLVLTVNSGYE